jgi:hypothetical protein
VKPEQVSKVTMRMPGGKDPDFWCAFEEGEVKEVIGDKPANTDCDPGSSEKAVS